MSQNSFYGGKQGRTYNIVAHYDSIFQMVTLFGGGGSYNDVNYNEYVIIDTFVNNNKRSSLENGLLYRRGMAYSIPFNPGNFVPLNENQTLTEHDLTDTEIEVYCTKDQLGHWCKDNITPPNTEDYCTAKVRLPRFRHFKCKIEKNLNADTGYSVVALQQQKLFTKAEADALPEDFYHFQTQWTNFVTNPGGGAEYVGQIVGPKSGASQIEVANWKKFIDTLDNERYEGAGETHATRQPGVIEYTDKQGREIIKYYDDIEFGYCNIVDEDGNITQALIAFNMPFTVIKTNTISVRPYGPNIEKVTSLPETKPSDIRTIYKIINTEGTEEYYIWDDNRVVLEDDTVYPTIYQKVPGFVKTVPWTATHDETNPHIWKQEGLVRERPDSIDHPYFKDLEINVPYGIHGKDFKGFNIYAQTPPDPDHPRDADELKAFGRDNGYHLYAYYQDYNYEEDGREEPKDFGHLQVIDKASLPLNESSQSYLYIDYFNDAQDKIPYPRVSNIAYAQNSGELTFTLIIGDGNQTWDPEHEQYEGTVTDTVGVLEYIATIVKEHDKNLNETKYLQAYYNTYLNPTQTEQGHKPVPTPVSSTINEIVKMQLHGDNLVVLYSDPTYRSQIANPEILPYTGSDWEGTGDIDGKYYWENLGPILNGEHIFGQFLKYSHLIKKYPYGFDKDEEGNPKPEMANYAGWVATVVTHENPDDPSTPVVETTLYAYDYYNNPSYGWYEISSIAVNDIEPRRTMIVANNNGAPNMPTPSVYGSMLQPHGYWFVTSEIEVATDN